MPQKKSKPIKDLSIKQWNAVEREIGRAILNPEDHGLVGLAEPSQDVDRAIALQALDQIVGRDGKDADGNYVKKSPSGGYTDDLVDGVCSTVRARRKQLS